ncbi:futalosine hydrolase [Cohnella caldifontis]|uniref:futalosine hydrolase n=1 Tax=Cohnella caldifontis TaxID=3027471 RepID=UPI0023EAD293|nr:futalosine hydrolase [Cohnella sp. YIM B05605]
MDKKVLVMTAVEAEREAVLRGLRGDSRFETALAGVGPAAAAARTSAALAGGTGFRGAAADGARTADSSAYGLVISAGIAGGFAGTAPVGSLVAASEIVLADLGAETPDGFLSVDELGFGSARFPCDRERTERLHRAWVSAGLQAGVGPILTVSTATGTAATAADRARRVPGAAAEGMEGGGVAAAAQVWGLPVMEIRAISNAVGPRDRSAWRIKEALDALESAFRYLPEVLFA